MDIGKLGARLKGIALSPLSSVARGLGTRWWGMFVPAVALTGLSSELTLRPQDLSRPISIDFKLPSEDAIPASAY